MLEGIEVVFIVIAIGAGGPLLVPASVGAGLALLVVVGLGLMVHRPLASVPENALKFGVGVLLSAFGSFWVGEGIGLQWPGDDWAILGLIVLYLVVALALVPACSHQHRLPVQRMPPKPRFTGVEPPALGAIGAVLRELWGLFVDDIWLALGTLAFVADVVGDSGASEGAHDVGGAALGSRTERRARPECFAAFERLTEPPTHD